MKNSVMNVWWCGRCWIYGLNVVFIRMWCEFMRNDIVMISVMCGGDVYRWIVVNLELLLKFRFVIIGILNRFSFFCVVCVFSISVNGMKFSMMGSVVCKL